MPSDKPKILKSPGLLHPLPITNSNWQSIGLPQTQRQKDTILVVVDCLSKMAHFMTTRETVEAPQVADMFIWNAFKLHGFPIPIVLD